MDAAAGATCGWLCHCNSGGTAGAADTASRLGTLSGGVSALTRGLLCHCGGRPTATAYNLGCGMLRHCSNGRRVRAVGMISRLCKLSGGISAVARGLHRHCSGGKTATACDLACGMLRHCSNSRRAGAAGTGSRLCRRSSAIFYRCWYAPVTVTVVRERPRAAGTGSRLCRRSSGYLHRCWYGLSSVYVQWWYLCRCYYCWHRWWLARYCSPVAMATAGGLAGGTLSYCNGGEG